ncbi:MAG: glycoside hydrolase family 97 catalytic domain-containing protein [Paludibacter sp.]|nr:glycoside hydrolase family 97 catalytic domain-containing protein [Paludibacter sp.]
MRLNNYILRLFIPAMLFLLAGKTVAQNVVATLKSPDNELSVQLLLDENAVLYYQLQKGSTPIISTSQMGLNTSLADFRSGLTFENATTESVNNTYNLPSGKKSWYLNHYNELKANFTKSGKSFQVVFRAYNEEIAFRYVINGTGSATISAEASECNPVTKEIMFAQTYSRDYKNVVEESNWNQLACLKYTSLPLLLKNAGNYILISEAAVNGTYSASKLMTNEANGAFVFQPEVAISTALPFQSPWRTIQTGSLQSIAASTLFENLNQTTAISDLSWIKPGKATWNYGGEDGTGYLTMSNIRKYIDWANEMGWEYFTLDKGWQNNSSIPIDQVLSYASSKKVGVFLWVNQQKLPATETELRTVLQAWKNKGVKGLKVDFWENDGQTMLKKYDLLFRLTSEIKLMLNLHSTTKPSGLRRTWPHLLTSEAVLSNSYYAMSPNVITASHNVNAAIIRSALGSTDYSPVDFADRNGKIHSSTTWAHQLALSVIFESGIQHIADAPENIRYNIAADFLKNLPVAWDDTKYLEAEPEKMVTVARQKADDWYVASLSNESREAEIDLSFLSPEKTYNAYIYKDGVCPSEILFDFRENIKSTDKLSLRTNEKGGFALILSPSLSFKKPQHSKYEAESSENIIPFGVSVKTDIDSLCSNYKYVSDIGKGRSLTFKNIRVQHTGTYALTFFYSSDAARTAFVKVNNKTESVSEYTFAGTGSLSGVGLAHKTVFVDLIAAAENTIEFGNITALAPNLDRIVLAPTGDIETALSPIFNNENEPKIYTVDKNIIIESTASCHFQIYNAMGQLVKTDSFGGAKILIPVQHEGVYVLKLCSEGEHFSEKVLIR